VMPLTAIAPQGAIAVSGITSGRDQYRPGYGWGDPNHNHTGPPGICRGTANPPDRANTPGCPPAALAPPLQARRTNDGLAAVVRTTVTISEQASLSIAVVDRAGKKLLLTQSSRRGGSTVGQGVEGPQTKVIRYQMLVPRALPVQLRIPVNLLRPGQLYRIVIQATDPQGNRRAITIPFRLTS